MMNLKNNWKMYVSLVLYALLGLAIGYGVAKGVMYFTNRKDAKVEVVEEVMSTSTSKYSGAVSAMFEGENKLDFSFNYDKNFTVTQGTENISKYFYVRDVTKNVAVVYLSYEGGRGYSASDYIANVISPRIAGLSAPETMTHASTTWMHVSNTGTDWHVMPVSGGEWLVVVESAKANKESVATILESFKAVASKAMTNNEGAAGSVMMMKASTTMELK
jgi:hypothetical protein